jgi:RimJ/RimL family protein N-acetyltransferase
VDIRVPDPPLTDGVVTLRPWNEDDVDALIDGIDGDLEIAAVRSMWREGLASPFAIIVDGEAVGGCGINWLERDQGVGDIGYWIRRDARGRGYVTRAVQLAARWAFECGCERLQLRADSENETSLRVAERAGFLREGVQRSARYNPRLGRRMNFVVFSLLPGELDDRQRG